MEMGPLAPLRSLGRDGTEGVDVEQPAYFEGTSSSTLSILYERFAQNVEKLTG